MEDGRGGRKEKRGKKGGRGDAMEAVGRRNCRGSRRECVEVYWPSKLLRNHLFQKKKRKPRLSMSTNQEQQQQRISQPLLRLLSHTTDNNKPVLAESLLNDTPSWHFPPNKVVYHFILKSQGAIKEFLNTDE